MCIYIYIHMYVCVYIYTYMYHNRPLRREARGATPLDGLPGEVRGGAQHVCVCTRIYVCVYTCIHVYIYIYIYTHVYIYIYRERERDVYDIYIYICVCVYIYIYIYISAGHPGVIPNYAITNYTMFNHLNVTLKTILNDQLRYITSECYS